MRLMVLKPTTAAVIDAHVSAKLAPLTGRILPVDSFVVAVGGSRFEVGTRETATDF